MSVIKPFLPIAATAGLMLWPQPTASAELGLEQAGLKVDVCHVPPGNPGNAHVINVSIMALPAHYAHGDPIFWTRNEDGSCSSGSDPEDPQIAT